MSSHTAILQRPHAILRHCLRILARLQRDATGELTSHAPSKQYIRYSPPNLRARSLRMRNIDGPPTSGVGVRKLIARASNVRACPERTELRTQEDVSPAFQPRGHWRTWDVSEDTGHRQGLPMVEDGGLEGGGPVLRARGRWRTRREFQSTLRPVDSGEA